MAQATSQVTCQIVKTEGLGLSCYLAPWTGPAENPVGVFPILARRVTFHGAWKGEVTAFGMEMRPVSGQGECAEERDTLGNVLHCRALPGLSEPSG